MIKNKQMAKTIQPNAKRRWWARTFRLNSPNASAFNQLAQARGVSVQVLFEELVEKEIRNNDKNMAAT